MFRDFRVYLDDIDEAIPTERHRRFVDFLQVLFEALLEFGFRGDSEASQEHLGQLGKEGLNDIQPGAVGGGKDKLKSIGSALEVVPGFLRQMGRVIIRDHARIRVDSG